VAFVSRRIVRECSPAMPAGRAAMPARLIVDHRGATGLRRIGARVRVTGRSGDGEPDRLPGGEGGRDLRGDVRRRSVGEDDVLTADDENRRTGLHGTVVSRIVGQQRVRRIVPTRTPAHR